MHRINLTATKKSVFVSHVMRSMPRIFVALMCGTAALLLWACSSTDFKGSAPRAPKTPENKEQDKERSPNESGQLRNESPPIDPKRALSLQITGLQPEAWWNNCLKVELGGKSFSIACTKDNNVTGRVVTIPIPEGVTCPKLKLKVETFVNEGGECAERFREGLSCNGPYATVPTMTRDHSLPADRPHFILSEERTSGTGKLLRVYFEDQPTDRLEDAEARPEIASELGIDFNDAVFEIRTLEAPFEIDGSAGTRCP